MTYDELMEFRKLALEARDNEPQRKPNQDMELVYQNREMWYEDIRDRLAALAKDTPPHQKTELNLLRNIVYCLAKCWMYGDWTAETANERDLEAYMKTLGWWPIPGNTLIEREKWLEIRMNIIQHMMSGKEI